MKGKPSQTLVAQLAAKAVLKSAEPGDRLEVEAEEVVEAVDQAGDGAELAVKHALPGEGGDVAGDRPGDDEEDAVEAAQAHRRA
jgi:hypothetical protein